MQDILQADRAVMRHSGRGWTILVLATVLTCYGLFYMSAFGLNFFSVFFVLAGPTAIAVGFALRRVRMRKMLRTYPAYIEEHDATLDESGLSVRTPSISSSMSWNMVNRVIDSGSIFVVQYSPVHYFIIPKRAFGSGTELEQAASLFRMNVSRYVGPSRAPSTTP